MALHVHLFAKMDNRLTVEFLAEQLGYDLSVIDAKKTFFHPALKTSEILKLVGFRYDKHFFTQKFFRQILLREILNLRASSLTLPLMILLM